MSEEWGNVVAKHDSVATPWAKYRYKAFISYSHRDRLWAERLESYLDAYKTPRSLRGRWTPEGPVPTALSPVFRDRSSLAADHDLTDALKGSIDDSATLIVICSPAASKSDYVNKEIEHFKATGRSHRVFAIVVDGKPESGGETECFPPAFLTTPPAAADARPVEEGGDGEEAAIIKVVAGILCVDPIDLSEKENAALKRRAARARITAVAMGALALASTGLAAVGWERNLAAQANARIAEENRSKAFEALDGVMALIGNEDYRPASGFGEFENAVSAIVVPFYESFTDQVGQDPAFSRQVGRAYAHQAGLADGAGKRAEALLLHKKSYDTLLAAVRAKAVDAKALDTFYDAAGIYAWRLMDGGEIELARSILKEGEQAGLSVGLNEQDIPEPLGLIAFVNSQGRLADSSEDSTASLAFMKRTEALARTALKKRPNDLSLQLALANSLSNQGLDYNELEKKSEARAANVAACEIRNAAYAARPFDPRVMKGRLDCLVSESGFQRDNGKVVDASQMAKQAIELAQLARRTHPESPNFVEYEARANTYLALAAERAGDTPLRLSALQRAMDIWVAHLVPTPVAPTTSFWVSYDFSNFAGALVDGDQALRLSKLRPVYDAFRGAADAFPEISTYNEVVAEAASGMAAALKSKTADGDLKEKVALLETSLKYSDRYRPSETPSRYDAKYEKYCETRADLGKALQDLGDSERSKAVFEKLLEICEPFLAKYPFDYWVRIPIETAHISLARIYRSKGEAAAAVPHLEYGVEWRISESASMLSEMYRKGEGVQKDIAKSDDFAARADLWPMKRFTVPIDFGGVSHPFHIYVREWPEKYPYLGISDQAEWVKQSRGGIVPKDVIDSFEKLHKIARENNVSFPELCVYALGKDGATKAPRSLEKINPRALTAGKASALAPDLQNETGVILLNGKSSLGEPTYTYLKLSLGKLVELRDVMKSGKDFIASNYGEVLASGIGEPPPELKKRMADDYNMKEIPKPTTAAGSSAQSVSGLGTGAPIPDPSPAFKVGDFKSAAELGRKRLEVVDKALADGRIKAAVAASEYGNQAYYLLFAREFVESENMSHKAIALDGTKTWLLTNLASALMFQDKIKEADAILDAHRGEIMPDMMTWEKLVAADFKLFREKGLDHPHIAVVLARFAD